MEERNEKVAGEDAVEDIDMGLPCCDLWMTDDEKAYRLAQLDREIEAGIVDVPLIPYLERLNAIPWLCTAQSCQGHRPYGTAVKNLGHISFRVTVEGWERFLRGLSAYEQEWPTLGWLGMAIETGENGHSYARFEVWWSEPEEWEQRVLALCRAFEEAPNVAG